MMKVKYFKLKFYKLFTENSEDFKGLSDKCSTLMVMEIANMILGYINGVSSIVHVLTFSYDKNQFTEKEKSIITLSV